MTNERPFEDLPNSSMIYEEVVKKKKRPKSY